MTRQAHKVTYRRRRIEQDERPLSPELNEYVGIVEYLDDATVFSELADRFRLNRTGYVGFDLVMSTLAFVTCILVHCSLREGLARTLPQAMLSGRPVVSFDVDGAREVVDADTGVLLQPKDVPGLQLAIETLADSPELRTKLGATGRARCIEHFDHNHMVEQIEKAYLRLLE